MRPNMYDPQNLRKLNAVISEILNPVIEGLKYINALTSFNYLKREFN